jgi:hypothetical protein
MKRSGILAVATLLGVALYPRLYWILFGLGSIYLLPPGLMHTARHLGGHAALVAAHWLVTVLLSLALVAPMAVAIALAFQRWWWVIAVVFGALLLAPDVVGLIESWREMADHVDMVQGVATDFVVVFAFALGSTYAASRLTSNLRWSGP